MYEFIPLKITIKKYAKMLKYALKNIVFFIKQVKIPNLFIINYYFLLFLQYDLNGKKIL